MVNVAQHVDPASQALLGWCIPKDLLKSWKNTVSYFWVSCNPILTRRCPSKKFDYRVQAGPSPGSLHYDEYDNVLFQLRGRKSVCVVPNRATTTLWGLPGWWQNLPNVSYCGRLLCVGVLTVVWHSTRGSTTSFFQRTR